MSTYIHKSHNVSNLMYPLGFPAKYRQAVFSEEVDKELRDICLEIARRYEIIFVEIGVDRDHPHLFKSHQPRFQPKNLSKTVRTQARKLMKFTDFSYGKESKYPKTG